jgi:hypothetical protein
MQFKTLIFTLTTLMASASFAAPAPAAPASGGVSAECRDGTHFTGDSKKGACAGHKGVKSWDGAAMPAAAPAAKPAAGASTMPTTPAAGGGVGKVWVNAKSNTYHCPGTKYYGKTKEGSYMTEGEAKAKGAHADHGKACK